MTIITANLLIITFLFFIFSINSRPGRPPKRSPVSGMVSPVPTSIHATTPTQQANAVPYLGFPATGKKPRFAEEAEFGNDCEYFKFMHNHHHLYIYWNCYNLVENKSINIVHWKDELFNSLQSSFFLFLFFIDCYEI